MAPGLPTPEETRKSRKPGTVVPASESNRPGPGGNVGREVAKTREDTLPILASTDMAPGPPETIFAFPPFFLTSRFPAEKVAGLPLDFFVVAPPDPFRSGPSFDPHILRGTVIKSLCGVQLRCNLQGRRGGCLSFCCVIPAPASAAPVNLVGDGAGTGAIYVIGSFGESTSTTQTVRERTWPRRWTPPSRR